MRGTACSTASLPHSLRDGFGCNGRDIRVGMSDSEPSASRFGEGKVPKYHLTHPASDIMADRGLERAVSGIAKNLDPVAVATYDNGRGILAIAESPVDSRARRAEIARGAAGRAGRMYDYMVVTPGELREIRCDPENPMAFVVASCQVVWGSMDGLRRDRILRIHRGGPPHRSDGLSIRSRYKC